MRLTLTLSSYCFFILIVTSTLRGQPVLPLFSIEEMQFIGAFRLPADEFGLSSLNYSQGPIEYSNAHHSIFIVGHSHHQAVAEFAIPDLVSSQNLVELEVSSAPLQLFTSVLDGVKGGNTQNIDRIGGMELIQTGTGQELVINAYEYYDAPADNTHSHLVIRDATDLVNSAIDGYYTHNGGAGHTSGWISPIPLIWQSTLGGTHITGQSSGIPIISRTSVGPSAFAFSKNDLIGTTVDPTPTHTLLDFSLDYPLHEDLSNSGGTNDLWTHLSQVTYGLIVPGTSTYLTIGHSGGHNSGVCYKCTQSDGNLCGGYCAPDADDYDQYYWLWDLNELLAVKNGTLAAFDVRPYDYGPLTVPHSDGRHEIGGGTFDPDQKTLYLSLQRADTSKECMPTHP